MRQRPLRGHLRRILRDIVLDLGIIVVAYITVFVVRAVTISLDLKNGFAFIGFAALLTVLSLYGFGAYHRIWSQTSGHSIVVLFKALGAVVSVLIFVDLMTFPRAIPFSVLLVANLLVFAGVVAIRYGARLLPGLVWRWDAVWNRKFPTNPLRVLIVGAGEAGQALAWRLKYRSPHQQYRVMGFIDDDPQKQQMYIEESQVLGTRHDLCNLVDQLNVELIAVAIHNISGDAFRDILTRCESTQARIKVIPNLFEMMDSRYGTESLRDVQPEDFIGRSPITRHEAIDLTPVTGKIVVITGAAGSIGSELSRQMAGYKPSKLILVDNNESGLHDLAVDLAASYPQHDLIPVLADITEEEPLRSMFAEHHPQVIFHAAAYKHVPLLERYPDAGIRTNVFGTLRLASLAQGYGVERFVLISTDKAVDPSSVMGATKRLGELIMHAFAQKADCPTRFTAVRFGNVLGSRGSVVPTFSRQIDHGGPVTITHPDMTRYFMSIPEAVNLVIHAACITQGDDIYLLKMGEVVRITDLAERMIRMRGLRPYVDIPIQFTGVRPGEKMHEVLFGPGEIPLETLHPHIILLGNRIREFNPESFLKQVKMLDGKRHHDCPDAFQDLIQLITPNRRYAVSAD